MDGRGPDADRDRECDARRQRGRRRPRRRLCEDQRHRHRLRHAARRPRARVRAVLHDQAGRQGHRAWPQPDFRLRARIGRRGRDRERGRQGHERFHLSAAHRSRRDRSGSIPRCSAASATSMSPAPGSCWSRTIRACAPRPSDALEDLDYEPVACRSGAEAIELFNAQAFDLVITDVIMPEMTGPELIRYLKTNEHARLRGAVRHRLCRRRRDRRPARLRAAAQALHRRRACQRGRRRACPN